MWLATRLRVAILPALTAWAICGEGTPVGGEVSHGLNARSTVLGVASSWLAFMELSTRVSRFMLSSTSALHGQHLVMAICSLISHAANQYVCPEDRQLGEGHFWASPKRRDVSHAGFH
jgi:hypothetical protein